MVRLQHQQFNSSFSGPGGPQRPRIRSTRCPCGLSSLWKVLLLWLDLAVDRPEVRETALVCRLDASTFPPERTLKGLVGELELLVGVVTEVAM